jgi:hypothetical protein
MFGWVTLNCDPGYEAVGNRYVMCRPNHEYLFDHGTCVAICPPYPAVEHGTVTTGGGESSDTAGHNMPFAHSGTRLTSDGENALVSENGVYSAVMQGDGNFVVYARHTALWDTGTWGQGTGPFTLAFQGVFLRVTE